MKMLLSLIIASSIVSVTIKAHVSDNWTHLYSKSFVDDNCIVPSYKKNVLFTQENIEPFNQLIFSWNIFRPESGHFSFYVQVRESSTKKWGVWHHMADWGNAIQQSYLSRSDGCSSYVYVRLELDEKKMADGFRIKIEKQKLASLSLVNSVAVACSNFNLFKSETISTLSVLPSVCLVGMPSMSQFSLDHSDKGRICSPVSCSMVVHYLSGKYKSPLDFMIGSFDDGLGVYGSWSFNTVHAFECCEGKVKFCVKRMNGFKDLHHELMKGLPVVVSVRGTLPGALKPFPHGHLIVVIGWDNDTHEVLCHDPACEKNDNVFKRYAVEDFLRAWECSHRLAYVAQKV